MKPEERLAEALDAVAPEPLPGSDDLVDRIRDVRQEVLEDITDVLLGVRMAADGTRSATGLNTHIQFCRQPTLAQLIQWQAKLQRALGKL